MKELRLTSNAPGASVRFISRRARRSLLLAALSVSALLTVMAPISANHGLHVGFNQACADGEGNGGDGSEGGGDHSGSNDGGHGDDNGDNGNNDGDNNDGDNNDNQGDNNDNNDEQTGNNGDGTPDQGSGDVPPPEPTGL